MNQSLFAFINSGGLFILRVGNSVLYEIKSQSQRKAHYRS